MELFGFVLLGLISGFFAGLLGLGGGLITVPAMALINSPFGIAAGSLPVITPPRMRAQVAASYMLVGAMGMMLGPPIAGAFNQFVFPGPDGVRYSLITVTIIFGSIGTACLWICRRHYAVSMRAANERFAT